MKTLSFFYVSLLVIGGLLMQGLFVQAQSLSGNYSLQSGEITLTLTLTQQGNTLQGTLQGNTGASFQLSGQVENNIGYGTCTGTEGSVFFEAYADGEDLTLSLVEPDANGAPDYNQAQYLPFKKNMSTTAGSATGAVTGALGLGATGQGTPGVGSAGQAGAGGGQSYAPATAGAGYIGQSGQVTGSMGSENIGENEVGDPSWGLKF